MATRASWLLVCATGAACADPAAVEVRILVEEPEVDTISLRISSAQDPRVDCRLPLAAAPEGRCPFEAGEEKWSEAGELSFVLYGEPGRAFEVEVDGERAGISVTATAAQSSLPEMAGERRVLQLSLLGRTRARYSCTLDLSPGVVEAEPFSTGDHSALQIVTPYSDVRAAQLAPLPVLVSARNALALVSYVRTPEGCQLEERRLVDASSDPVRPDFHRWCSLRGGALAARTVPESGTVVLAGVCADEAAPRLKVALLTARETSITTYAMPPNAEGISDPVIAKTGAEGRFEVFTLVYEAGGGVSLGRLHNDGRQLRAEQVALPGLRRPEGARFGPLVLPAGPSGLEALLIVGYGGGSAVFSGGRVLPSGSAWPSVRPPVGYMLGARPGLLTLTSGGEVVNSTFGVGQQMWRSMELSRTGLDVTPGADAEAALTLGRPEQGAAPKLALFEDGVAQLVSFDSPPSVETLDVWRGAASDAQLTRWANLDGRPGAELLSFTPRGASVAAVRLDGTPLEGWPLELPATGAARRLALADLDGISGRNEDGLRDVEVVSLTDRRLTVVTLGPGSYEFSGLEWPLARGTPHGSALWTGRGDPTRAPAR